MSDVQSVIGSDAQTATQIVIPTPVFNLTGCVWTSKDGTLTVAVGPKNIDKSAFDTAMKATTLMTPVSGVGDSAYSFKLDPPTGFAGAAGIVVVKNGQYFTIQVAHKTGSSTSLSTVITDLAKTMAGKIQ